MPEKRQNAEIKSPCVHHCTLDFETGYCYGCGRNMQEISQWAKFSSNQRDLVLGQLPARLKKLET